jgi:periplasmic copper chaperone A
VKRARFAILCLLTAAPVALAQSDRQEMLEILEPYAPAMTDAKTIHVPVYMTIRNRGERNERLLAARTPYADKVELIELRQAIGMQLPMSADELLVAPGATLALNPYGPRLLLSGVKQPLRAFDMFPVTLIFERAGPIDIEVMVATQSAGHPHRP